MTKADIVKELKVLDEDQEQIVDQLNNNDFLNNFADKHLGFVEFDFNCSLFCTEVLIGVLNGMAQDKRYDIPPSKACIDSIYLMHELSQIREERALLTSAWIVGQS